MNRRAWILLVVLAVLVGVYLWSERPGPVAAGGPLAGLTGQSAGERVTALATADLDRSGGEFRLGRDLFRYGAAPRPAPQTAERAPERSRPAPSRPTPPRPKPLEPAKPQPPAVDVVYLGSFGHAGHRIAVFSDAEGVYNAQVGDVIKDKFVLVTIGYESADLGFVGFPDAPPQRLAVGRL